MRRRTRVDLGQGTSSKEEFTLERKRRRWAERNKYKPSDENPFLAAIHPDHESYGDSDEKGDELKARLNNLEFGNFPGYFNYRNKSVSANDRSNESSTKDNSSSDVAKACDKIDEKTPLDSGLSDQRLKHFQKEWFNGKDVLDIGCNRGHITYAIARLFSPNSVVGTDIDSKIISMANKDLHLYLEESLIQENCEARLKHATKLRIDTSNDNSKYIENPEHYPLFSYISRGPLILDQKGLSKEKEEDEVIEKFKFPNNIIFVEHNYVLARDDLVDKQKEYFDTIVCLSVTKWVHLNYRDDGLKRFFKRIYRHLKPNGVLILESQPFDNYERRRKLSDRLKANYYSIQLKPDQFDSYLLGEQVGFKRIIYESVTQHEHAGFKRPLKVFLK